MVQDRIEPPEIDRLEMVIDATRVEGLLLVT